LFLRIWKVGGAKQVVIQCHWLKKKSLWQLIFIPHMNNNSNGDADTNPKICPLSQVCAKTSPPKGEGAPEFLDRHWALHFYKGSGALTVQSSDGMLFPV
jgi:hypothetical protein